MRAVVESRPVVEGMYVDGKRCCVFVMPVKWSPEGTAMVWNMHGAWHEKSARYGTDWFARATRDDGGNLIMEHTSSKKDYGTLTKSGIKWKKESWTRVHSVAPQFAYFRRPPYPMMSLFLLLSFAKCVAWSWGLVAKPLVCLVSSWRKKR